MAVTVIHLGVTGVARGVRLGLLQRLHRARRRPHGVQALNEVIRLATASTHIATCSTHGRQERQVRQPGAEQAR